MFSLSKEYLTNKKLENIHKLTPNYNFANIYQNCRVNPLYIKNILNFQGTHEDVSS